jgi:arginase family enzyme
MIGVPFDAAVTNRPGARHGPREIRNMSSLMRAIHPVSKINPYKLCRIGDLGDVAGVSVFSTFQHIVRLAVWQAMRSILFNLAGLPEIGAGGTGWQGDC